jgi:hypothetical protein
MHSREKYQAACHNIIEKELQQVTPFDPDVMIPTKIFHMSATTIHQRSSKQKSVNHQHHRTSIHSEGCCSALPGTFVLMTSYLYAPLDTTALLLLSYTTAFTPWVPTSRPTKSPAIVTSQPSPLPALYFPTGCQKLVLKDCEPHLLQQRPAWLPLLESDIRFPAASPNLSKCEAEVVTERIIEVHSRLIASAYGVLSVGS